MLITSVNNVKIKELVKLKDKKYRDKTGLFFIEGFDMFMEAYKSSLISELYVLDGTDVPYDIPRTYVSYDVMKKISDMESVSKYYCVCHKINKHNIGNKIMILDNLQDPGNLGTIIRSAVAFNIDTIVISNDTVDLYNPKVLRSTKGMIFNINIIVASLCDFISSLNNYKIYGTSVVDGVNIREINFPSKYAIVIGNEGNGIHDDVKKLCDEFLYIYMSNKCESLNASVAASIIMYEVSGR